MKFYKLLPSKNTSGLPLNPQLNWKFGEIPPIIPWHLQLSPRLRH